MSEHHKHTEFLKHCLSYDDSSERHQMLEKLVRLQHELRIVRRARWLVIFLTALAVAGLAYSSFLLQNLSHSAQHSIMNLLLALIVGLLISLLAFVILGTCLRVKLHRQREVCRQQLKRFLAARLGPTP
jgi:hypothetical protein